MKDNFIKEWSNQSGFSYLALLLALASLLLLCIPFVGYLAILLSGAGLILGGYEVCRALTRNQGNIGYSLAAIAACLASSALAFMPWLR